MKREPRKLAYVGSRLRAARVSSLLAMALALSCVIELAAPALANAAGGALHLQKSPQGAAATPSASKPHWACPEGACEAIVAPTPVKVADGYTLPGSSRLLEGGGELGGYDPADLKSAYDIPTGTEDTQTIALVDAYGYPNAEADLAAYRTRYDLPACTKASGCFKKVNEKGEEANYPANEGGWNTEAALDSDMASAACPECHILMVEASGEELAQIAASVNEAAALGANEISNSYGYAELYECADRCEAYDADYQHPGVEIFASAGDAGYMDVYDGLHMTNFPASAPSVVAVGGTALYKGGGTRGWHETVWNELGSATGAGCTAAQPKPSWQLDAGCSHRTDNDVAAVAAVKTGVSVRVNGEWALVGGTSASSPLVAGIEAHASSIVRGLGARAFYDQPGTLNDVTEGFAGFEATECEPYAYLCDAEVGYDGPTGLGTPNGVPPTPAAPTATITAPKPNKTYAVVSKVKTVFACAEGANGPGLESCTDSNGASGGKGTLNTATPGIFSYTVTAKSIDGETGTAKITYAVAPKGYKAYDMCVLEVGCGAALLVDTRSKRWQLTGYEESGTVETVAGKPRKTNFVVTSGPASGCVYTAVQTKSGYNSAEQPSGLVCDGVVVEEWYASKL